jgi:hypothetical protein
MGDAINSRLRVGARINIMLDYIDDVSEEVHLNLELAMHWNDDRIHHFQATQIGTSHLSFVPESLQIEQPCIEFSEARSVDLKQSILLYSHKTGIIYCLQIYRLVLKDVLDLHYFPFDRQIVRLELDSYIQYFDRWTAPLHDAPSRIWAHPIWKDNQFVISSKMTFG